MIYTQALAEAVTADTGRALSLGRRICDLATPDAIRAAAVWTNRDYPQAAAEIAQGDPVIEVTAYFDLDPGEHNATHLMVMVCGYVIAPDGGLIAAGGVWSERIPLRFGGHLDPLDCAADILRPDLADVEVPVRYRHHR